MIAACLLVVLSATNILSTGFTVYATTELTESADMTDRFKYTAATPSDAEYISVDAASPSDA